MATPADDLGCRGVCCLFCICGAKAICNWYTFLAGVALAAVAAAAFAFPDPVLATVTEARLDLIDNTHGDGADAGAGPAPSSLAYNLSLAVVVRNQNWAMRAELAAPLDAELRLAGRRIGGARLAGAGRSVAPWRAAEFRVVLAGSSSSPRGVSLGSESDDTAAAERAVRESAASASGVFELELKLAGKIRYHILHVGRSRRLQVTCPVKMLMPAPATTTPPGTHQLMVLDKVITCD